MKRHGSIDTKSWIAGGARPKRQRTVVAFSAGEAATSPDGSQVICLLRPGTVPALVPLTVGSEAPC